MTAPDCTLGGEFGGAAAAERLPHFCSTAALVGGEAALAVPGDWYN